MTEPKRPQDEDSISYAYTLDSAAWPTTTGIFSASGATIYIDKQSGKKTGPTEFGTLDWSGYAYPGRKTEIRGGVTDPVTKNAVGVTDLIHDSDGTVNGYATNGIYEALSDDDATADYWASIQSCQQVSASQKQTLVERATNTNTLFKLTNTERQRLLQ